MTKLVAAFAALLPLFLSAQLAAQPSDRDQAIAHYNQGEAYFKAGTFDKAVEEYRKAYALVPRSGLLFNIALALEKDGKRDEAIASYERYLAAEANGVKSTEARARLEALKRSRDEELRKKQTIEGHRKRAEELTTAGKHLEAVAELRSLHALTADAKVLFLIGLAYENAGQKDLASSEYARYLETGDSTYAADAARRRRELDRKPPDEIKPPIGDPQPGPVDHSERPSIVLPIVASVVSGSLLVGGVLTGLRVNSIKSDIQDNLDNRNPPLDNSDERFDDGRSAATVATTFFVVSAVGAGVSGYLWWRYFDKSKGESPRSSTYVAPTSSGFAVGGTF